MKNSQNILWKHLHLDKDDADTSHIPVILICYRDKDVGLKWRSPQIGDYLDFISMVQDRGPI